MSLLGLVGSAIRPADTASPAPPCLQLILEDTIASSRRLWLRGRLRGSAHSFTKADARSWWEVWRRPGTPTVPLPPARLQTRIHGRVIDSDVPIGDDGRFEASLEVDLPPVRRGWRIARHQLTWGEMTADACSVVLVPPVDATHAVGVVLPFAHTVDASRLQLLAHEPLEKHFAEALQQATRSSWPVFYVAVVPPGGEVRQAELALALTALGWPAGTVLLLPTSAELALEETTTALDRLRWLFADSLTLEVVSAEPALDAAGTRRVPCAGDGTESDPATPGDGTRSVPATLVGGRPPRPTRAGLLPQYPVVFCHGMLATSMLKMSIPQDTNCFTPLREFFKVRGFRVLYPQVPATSGVVERAAVLRDLIRHWTDEPVNLIAHSMGGLDARYMITHLGMAERVRSLTTISTPHRGTYLAEWFLANFRQRVPLLHALEAIGVNVDGFRDCLRAACRAFNDTTPDCPAVRYFSYGGQVTLSRLSPTLRRGWSLLSAVEGPNDGMISMASARWGEYLGTINADHFAQTPDGVLLRAGEDFDSLAFYARLVEDLARLGF